MAERDISGRLTQRSAATIGRLRRRMNDMMPYGPLREKLTDKEARERLQNIDPMAKQELIKRMGVDEWDRLLEQLYGRQQ